MLSMINIETLALKHKLIGHTVLYNSWGLCVRNDDNTFQIELETMDKFAGFCSANVYKHFIVAWIEVPSARIKEAKIFIKGKSSPILNNCRFYDASHDTAIPDPYQTRVLILRGKNCRYLVDYTGKKLKLPMYLSSVRSEIKNGKLVYGIRSQFQYAADSETLHWADEKLVNLQTVK